MAAITNGGCGVEVELRGVTALYDGGGGVRKLDLTLPRGEVTAVVGPSGAGKSTLLQVVAGLLRPSAGVVLFDGSDVTSRAPEVRDLGVVFQSYALFPHLTVRDNVAFPLRVRGVGRARARGRVEEILERLEIAPLAHRRPGELSGGERQRVALARALAAEPRALLLDEPLAALDAKLRLALRTELARRLAEAGRTALYVTHDQEEAMALGDRVAVVRDGRLEQVGRPEELYLAPATPFVASFIGEASFLPVELDPATRRLRGPFGDWSAGDLPTNGHRGGPGALMVRPEGFFPADPGRGHLAGRVVSSTFLGARRRLEVEVEGSGGLSRRLRVDVPARTRIAGGERLELAIELERSVLLSEDPSIEKRGDTP